MSTVAIASIAVGILIIATRGPLLFAPEATVRAYRRLAETSTRIRILACVLAAMGAAFLFAGDGSRGGLATAIAVVGWLFVPASILLMFSPKVYRQLMEAVLDGFDPAALRVTGALAAGVGAFFVYLGVTAA